MSHRRIQNRQALLRIGTAYLDELVTRPLSKLRTAPTEPLIAAL